MAQGNFDFLCSPRGVGQGLGDVLGLKVGVSLRISFRVRPAAMSPTTVPTVTRMPRMHGFPPITRGSRVIRVSCGMSDSGLEPVTPEAARHEVEIAKVRSERLASLLRIS